MNWPRAWVARGQYVGGPDLLLNLPGVHSRVSGAAVHRFQPGAPPVAFMYITIAGTFVNPLI